MVTPLYIRKIDTSFNLQKGFWRPPPKQQLPQHKHPIVRTRGPTIDATGYKGSVKQMQLLGKNVGKRAAVAPNCWDVGIINRACDISSKSIRNWHELLKSVLITFAIVITI